MQQSEGVAVLWIESPDGLLIEKPNAQSMDEQANQLCIINVAAEGVELVLVFRRADFNHLLANPNNPNAAIDCAATMMLEEHNDSGTESGLGGAEPV